VTPIYPSTARQYQISGVVKLEVKVAADGSVHGTKVLAGHPMLTSSAVDAVSHWKFEPGPESVESVEVNFSR
jgi:protein TonB